MACGSGQHPGRDRSTWSARTGTPAPAQADSQAQAALGRVSGDRTGAAVPLPPGLTSPLAPSPSRCRASNHPESRRCQPEFNLTWFSLVPMGTVPLSRRRSPWAGADLGAGKFVVKIVRLWIEPRFGNEFWGASDVLPETPRGYRLGPNRSFAETPFPKARANRSTFFLKARVVNVTSFPIARAGSRRSSRKHEHLSAVLPESTSHAGIGRPANR